MYWAWRAFARMAGSLCLFQSRLRLCDQPAIFECDIHASIPVFVRPGVGGNCFALAVEHLSWRVENGDNLEIGHTFLQSLVIVQSDAGPLRPGKDQKNWGVSHRSEDSCGRHR